MCSFFQQLSQISFIYTGILRGCGRRRLDGLSQNIKFGRWGQLLGHSLTTSAQGNLLSQLFSWNKGTSCIVAVCLWLTQWRVKTRLFCRLTPYAMPMPSQAAVTAVGVGETSPSVHICICICICVYVIKYKIIYSGYKILRPVLVCIFVFVFEYL